jgi:hypothetical protein
VTGAQDLSGAPARHRPWPLCRRCCGIAPDMGSARTAAESGVIRSSPGTSAGWISNSSKPAPTARESSASATA